MAGAQSAAYLAMKALISAGISSPGSR